MTDFESGCRGKAWIGGAVAGLLVFAFVLAVSGMGFGAAVFLGVLTFLFLGAFFVWAFCTGSGIALAPPPAQIKSVEPVVPAPIVPPEPIAPAHVAAAAPVATPAPAPVMAPVEPAEKDAKQTEPQTAKPKARSKTAKKAGDGKPKGLKAPRKGKPDDLKLIEGIGPKLEERLNEWGIFHFDQIAGWGPEEVAYADENVPRFKGRASRDKWVAQAKIIVEEGLDAFLERAKTNDY